MAEKIAGLMDDQFSVLGFRFGLDPILGLFPGAGDAITTLFSMYLLWVGWRVGLSGNILARMGLNILIDVAVGSIPILGDLLDFGIKANRKNLEILRRELDRGVVVG